MGVKIHPVNLVETQRFSEEDREQSRGRSRHHFLGDWDVFLGITLLRIDANGKWDNLMSKNTEHVVISDNK